MRRLNLLILAAGLSCLFLGLALFGLQNPQTASAALPPGHPQISAENPADAIIPSTDNDFFLPGTQPLTLVDNIADPTGCPICHAGYAHWTGQPEDTETWTGWQGSMMAQSARDPLFWAALDIAGVDAAQSEQLCLRCHTPSGFLEGHTMPPDGSNLTPKDLEGVQCEFCHRMVDPIYSPENPDRDVIVLAGIDPPLTFTGNGAIIVDPEAERRGPYDLRDDLTSNPHLTMGLDWPLQSPFHREAALCGSCHDVSNPLLNWDDVRGEYWLNDLDTPASDPDTLFPVERTYSEWLLSEYNTPGGVYAPQFGGNEPYVSTCQDCHMRAITGAGGAFYGNDPFIRDDLGVHDLTGGNTWVPQTLPLHPLFGDTFPEGGLRARALISGTVRARYMLQHAASLSVNLDQNQLHVTVANESGHKLPSGYPEGRRMWLQVEGYNENGDLIYTSGAYDVDTGILQGYETDPTLKVYEITPGLTEAWADELGLSPGPTFHFVLNNVTVFDNRIPPRGYDYDAFLALGAAPYTNGQPDPDRYENGQYWDLTVYDLPDEVAYGRVRLLYQTASKEYIDFLRDNNPAFGDPGNNGQILYDLWELTERSKPEVMAESYFGSIAFLPLLQK